MDQETSARQAVRTLSKMDIFSSLDPDQLKQLVALGEIAHVPPDTILFEEGDEGDKLYLILEGSMEVTTRADPHVFLLNKGEVLGEIALLDGLPRTATVTTAEECTLFGLSRQRFESFLALDTGLAFNIMAVTNRKIRAALGREKELNASLREVNQELERLNETLEGLVEQKTQQLRLANQNLKEMLERDPLTGTYNRRKFDALMEEFTAAPAPFALVMLDIDHFKSINDTHGHQTGDRVLMKLAEVVGKGLVTGHYLARYGGEEFALVLRDIELETAANLAEDVRAIIERHHFPIRGCAPGAVTASLGVAHSPRHAHDVEGMIKAADEALYEAKRNGRNQVVVAGVTAGT